MTSEKITFVLNWHATPYHYPVFAAQFKGYFAEEGIQVAILEPSDPSDVAELVGRPGGQLGAKAMVHTIAAKARGFNLMSIGTIMDEPVTGIVYLKDSGVTTDFQSLKGKRIGYVGEFGKIQIDELCQYHNMLPSDYTAVRVGMAVTESIISGRIDCGIGLENVQVVELEQWCLSQGRPITDVCLLSIADLAELGCCCFCTILYIANEEFVKNNPTKIAAFMRAVKKAADYLQADPVQAWKEYCIHKKTMNTPVNAMIFERSLVYMSKDCKNVARDWSKVTGYCKRLGIIEGDFVPNYTNEYIAWELEPELEDPDENQIIVAREQERIKLVGGVLATAPAAQAVVVASA